MSTLRTFNQKPIIYAAGVVFISEKRYTRYGSLWLDRVYCLPYKSRDERRRIVHDFNMMKSKNQTVTIIPEL